MMELGGAFLAGAALGPLVDRWITIQLARDGLRRSESWVMANRLMLPLALGLGWVLAWSQVGWTGILPAHLGWVTVTSALVVTDLEHRLIPNRILYPAGIVTILLLMGGALVDGMPGRLGDAFLSAALCLVGMGGLSVLGRGALGMGDAKLSGLLGLICGYRGVEIALQAVLAGFLIGGGAALVLLLSGRARRQTHIPFAPALVAAAWLSLSGPHL